MCVTWIPCKLEIPSRFLPCNFVILSCFISWKTHFLILAGSAFSQIWLGQLNALPTKIRKWVFHGIKCDGITSLHGIKRDGITSLHEIHENTIKGKFKISGNSWFQKCQHQINEKN